MYTSQYTGAQIDNTLAKAREVLVDKTVKLPVAQGGTGVGSIPEMLQTFGVPSLRGGYGAVSSSNTINIDETFKSGFWIVRQPADIQYVSGTFPTNYDSEGTNARVLKIFCSRYKNDNETDHTFIRQRIEGVYSNRTWERVYRGGAWSAWSEIGRSNVLTYTGNGSTNSRTIPIPYYAGLIVIANNKKYGFTIVSTAGENVVLGSSYAANVAGITLTNASGISSTLTLATNNTAVNASSTTYTVYIIG